MLSVWVHFPLASGFTKYSFTDRKSWRDVCRRTTPRLDSYPAYWEITPLLWNQLKKSQSLNTDCNSGPHTNLQEETPEFHPWYIKPYRETLVNKVLKSQKKLLKKKILLSHKNNFNVKFVKYHPIYSPSFSSNVRLYYNMSVEIWWLRNSNFS